MKTLHINWLGECPQCGSNGPHSVTTELGSDSELYSGDAVTCGDCGNEGVIEVCDESAYCEWDEEFKDD